MNNNCRIYKFSLDFILKNLNKDRFIYSDSEDTTTLRISNPMSNTIIIEEFDNNVAICKFTFHISLLNGAFYIMPSAKCMSTKYSEYEYTFETDYKDDELIIKIIKKHPLIELKFDKNQVLRSILNLSITDKAIITNLNNKDMNCFIEYVDGLDAYKVTSIVKLDFLKSINISFYIKLVLTDDRKFNIEMLNIANVLDTDMTISYHDDKDNDSIFYIAALEK